MSAYFLWPESRFINILKSSPNFSSTRKIESLLKDMFPSGTPVLCSSGRAAICLALSYLKHKRPDIVAVNPFTSHCVLDAVSRVATPTTWRNENINVKTRLIYHQWSFIQENSLNIPTIDDCVDSLCITGTELFPTSNVFEIWSLPKILGTSSGAILWCKDEVIAEHLRILRKERGGGLAEWLLRLMSFSIKDLYWLWQGIEPQRGNVSFIQKFEISEAIKNWDKIVNDRLSKLNLIWKYAPKWLSKPSKRLPPVVPIQVNKNTKEIFSNKISTGIRHIEKVNLNKTRELIKVLPIPIHQDVPLSYIKKILPILDNNYQIN